MISNWHNVLLRRDLLRELIVSELKATSAETKLGWLWWVLDPLILMLIYWAVVVGILGRGQQYHPYPLFVLCGLLPWNHVSSSLGKAVRVLAQRESLIKSVPFPTMALPLSLVVSRLVYLCIGLVVLVGIAVLAGKPIGGAILQIPVLVLSQVVLVMGLSLMVAAYGVIVPDLATAIYYILRVLFYASPVIYGVDIVREKLQALQDGGAGWARAAEVLYMFNPFAILITGYRDAIMYRRFLPLHWWIVLFLEVTLVFWIGQAIYRHYDRRVIKFI
jgi:ABC-type polysaccharide/polyol phosphate export permease